jgi:hypothetical protein
MDEAFQKIVSELQRSRQDSHELAHHLDEITALVSMSQLSCSKLDGSYNVDETK